MSSDTFDEITIGVYQLATFFVKRVNGQRDRGTERDTHQIEINTMIHQVILPRLHIPRRTKVHPIHLAHLLDLLIRPRQANDLRMELLQIRAQHIRRIAHRITGDKHRQEETLVFRGVVDIVDNRGHFVQFVGTDIRAMCEAKVDLPTTIRTPSTISNNPG